MQFAFEFQQPLRFVHPFGCVIFSFFAIGDQVFGDRGELLEHTIYWMALIVSWGAYKFLPEK